MPMPEGIAGRRVEITEPRREIRRQDAADGIVLYVSSLGTSRCKSARGTYGPFRHAMDRVLAVYHASDLTRGSRPGTITYYEPARRCLQEGSKSLWIETTRASLCRSAIEPRRSGFPSHERRLSLADGEIEIATSFSHRTDSCHLAATGFWTSNMPVGHLYDLVRLKAKWRRSQGASQDEYVSLPMVGCSRPSTGTALERRASAHDGDSTGSRVRVTASA